MTNIQEQKRIYMREYARKRRATDPVFVEKCREISRKSREKNKDVANQRSAEWRAKNKNKVAEYNKEYALKNKEKITQQACERNKQRRKIDPTFVLIRRERVRAYDALKGIRKAARTETLLGCSYAKFRIYIENLFVDGMGWHNSHLWHIDHIRPLASFDLTDKEQQKLAFNYKNQQPLWATDNLKKGAKHA